MTSFEELFSLSEKLNESASWLDIDDVAKPLNNLKQAAQQVELSFSGSWLGYHSRVYYLGFQKPPPGYHFSQELGLKGNYLMDDFRSHGEWKEYDADIVKEHIQRISKKSNLDVARRRAEDTSKIFKFSQSDIISILQNELNQDNDIHLKKLKGEIENLKPISALEMEKYLSPKRKITSRDRIAIGQGIQTPPHMVYLAEIRSIHHLFGICKDARDIAKKSASHLGRKSRVKKAADRVGTKVFIGHGRSDVWLKLKDFLQDRVKLPWDEFNRVPVAGTTNTARLSEMLDEAAISFLVMTAEDEKADGAVQARMNVIHEYGLFQGRLGFSKAIVLLEEG